MGIFDFLRREEKASATAQAIVLSPGQPVWTPRDYASFAKEAYAQNVVAYQCINKIGEAVGSVKWTAWRGEQEVEGTGLIDMIEQPNEKQSRSDYLMERVGYEMIAGNAYQERLTVGGVAREMYNLRPDRMSIIPDASGEVRKYVYKVGGNKVTWDVDRGVSDILHSKTFNPLNDFYGLSPVEAGAYAIDQHNAAMSWMQALLQNSARPSGALVYDGGPLDDDAFNRLKAQMEEQYSGAHNAGRPMLLESGLDWKAMGMTPNDMQAIETKNSAARDIALSFGVPPMLLGIPGDNTYANYAEARLSFWEDTVVPLLERIGGEWTRWLGPQFGGLTVKPDLDAVPAIADKRRTLFEIAGQAAFLTLNEKREMTGFGPIDGGDEIQRTDMQEPQEPSVKDIAAIIGYG